MRIIEARKRKRGITLIEVLVATAIVMMLLAVAWLALGPVVRAKGRDARIFSNLHQVTVAIAIYMADHDDKLPNQFKDLPKSTPQGLPGRETGPNALNEAGFMGPRAYDLIYNQRDANDAEYYNCEYRWSPTENPIVMAGFRSRATGAKYPLRWPMEGEEAWKWVDTDEYLRPHGFLDGHTGWHRHPEEWLNELMNRRDFKRRRP